MIRPRFRPTLALIQAIVQYLQKGYAQDGFSLPSQCSDPTYTWLSNSAGRTPCDVVNTISSECPVVTQGSRRPLPSSSCACNTVLYSVVYACGLCADSSEFQITFGAYAATVNCDATLVKQYSGSIPPGVSIPPWAYLDLTNNDTFDVAAAEELVQSTGEAPTVTSTLISTSGTTKTQPPKATTPALGDTSLTDHTTANSESSDGSGTSTHPLLPTVAIPGTTSSSADHDASELPSTNTPTGTTQADRTGTPTISDPVVGASFNMTGTVTTMSSATQGKTIPPSTANHSKTAASMSLATIVGLVIAGIGAPLLVICGIMLAIRRRRHRTVTVDGGVNEGQATSEAEPVHSSDPEPPVSQYTQQGGSPASQPPPAPQERSPVAQFPEVKMANLYDPDDPTTYPPSLSVILGGPAVPNEGTDDPPAYSP